MRPLRMERDNITKCPDHQTAPLKVLSLEAFNFMAAYDSLVLDLVWQADCKRIGSNE